MIVHDLPHPKVEENAGLFIRTHRHNFDSTHTHTGMLAKPSYANDVCKGRATSAQSAQQQRQQKKKRKAEAKTTKTDRSLLLLSLFPRLKVLVGTGCLSQDQATDLSSC
mmetsp:Transcript_79399/g.174143  ORF Transcript_79399/g.174143 Transcript_79399/m.174143 type:complete len:109 (-) Transcript_79399:56-382(-)